jgi:Nif-specific regulatory protein
LIERFAGRYALLQRLGHGGMGEVFLARDLTTGAECALKRLTWGRSRAVGAAPGIPGAEAGGPRTLGLGLMEAEFRLLAGVRHPAVVSVFELGFAPDGGPFFTMEYVPGLPADQVLARGDRAALGFVAVQLALGLEALHDLGIVHGDLKPSNVLVLPGREPDGLPAGVKLLDFGLARLERDVGTGHRGTPGFAAPEVVSGQAPAPASDLYGFGATLFVLATGGRPFEAPTVQGILRLQQAGPPAATVLEQSGMPAAFVRLVLRLLSPAPAERGDGMREVRRELERMFPTARLPLAERLRAGRPVGREREFARLEAWIASWTPADARAAVPGVPTSSRGTGARGSRPRATAPGARALARVRLQIIMGAEGIGVSSMLDELAARAAISGRGVVRVSGAMPPGAAARVLVRRLTGAGGSVPPAAQRLPDRLSTWLEADDAPLHEKDVDVLAEVLSARLASAYAGSGTPLVLIDEGERLDAETVALVRRLVMGPEESALRAVWARRGTRSSLGADDRALCTAGVANVLELGPLRRADMALLVADRLGTPAPESLTDWLWTNAAGHPGLSVELLHHAARAGAIVEDESGLRADPPALGALSVPESFATSRLARWESLPAGARRAATALAGWGRPASLDDVRALDPAADEVALEELLREGLAARDEDGRFALSPPSLAARVLERLEPAARQEVHRAALRTGRLSAAERFDHLREAGEIPDALAAAEAAFSERPDERIAVAAAGLCASSVPAEAARWYERAGNTLVDHARQAASIPMFERALALDPRGDAHHMRRVALARALYWTGDITRQESLIAEALADAPPPAVRLQLLVTAGSALMARGRYEEAQNNLGEALSLGEALGDLRETGSAAMSLAGALTRLERLGEAESCGNRAVAAFRTAHETRLMLRAGGVVAIIARQAGRYDEAQSRLGELLGTAHEARERLVLEELLTYRATLLVELGRWRAAREDVSAALQIALEDGRTTNVAHKLTTSAILDGLTGRTREARRHARAAVRMTREAYPSMQAMAWRSLAQANRISGRLVAADRLARRSLAVAGTPLDERDWGRLELGRTLLARGRAAEARALLGSAAELEAITTLGRAALVLLVARAALRLGDVAAAQKLLVAAESWRADRPLAYLAALESQANAEIALARGVAADASTAAQAALEMFAALPAPGERAMAALDFARLWAGEEADERVPVVRWLEEAAATFQQLGDVRARQSALALLVRQLKRARPASGRPARAHDLITAVRRLLDSLSDMRELAQVAMRLVVDQLDAERGVLLLANSDDGQMVEMAEHGAVDASTRQTAAGYSRRVVERVARGGGVVLLGDAVSDPASLSESIVDLQLRSILCVPMYVAGRVVGAVYLDDSRRTDAFSDDDRALLEGFAQLMAVAFEKSRGQEEVERANRQLVGENLQLRRQAGVRFQAQNLIATSSEMQRILAVVERVAHSDATVLLTGENGTGKEMIALTLHHTGRRRDRPFVAVNCGAIPETLLESELFGILPRVATGVGGREGRFVQANGGTLFLDEVADMPLLQQVALLRVLATREVTPVGGGPAILVDVRVIAATNRDLAHQVEIGAFREDLYHRLNVIPIEVPPLRERKADIPALATHFAAQFASQQQREAPRLSPELLAALMQSDWPGNVRALQNYIERIMAMNPGPVLHPRPLPRDLEAQPGLRMPRGRKLASVVEDLERRMISEALERTEGNQSAAAKELGLSEPSLRYKLKKYGAPGSRQKLRHRKK